MIDTFDLALLGLEGSVPFFDPVNGYRLEEEGYIGRLVPEHTGNFSVNVVFPASGCELIAKVRRRDTSLFKSVITHPYLGSIYKLFVTKCQMCGEYFCGYRTFSNLCINP